MCFFLVIDLFTLFHLTGLKVTANMEHKMKWPCESTHRITFSLAGVDPVNVRLPFPVFLPSNLNSIAVPRKGGVVEIVLEKALYDLWPEDIVPDRLRWNPEMFTILTDLEVLDMHLTYQFRRDYWQNLANGIDKPETDVMTKVRQIIHKIFDTVIRDGHERFQLKVEESTDSPDWFIRAHPPVRTSPSGTPILLLSALDHHLQERLQSEGKLDIDRSKKSFHRVYGHVSAEEKVVISIESPKVAQVLRYVLRLNSTKILPSSWQTENLPTGKSPWLATFVRPLYRDSIHDLSPLLTPESVAIEVVCCAKCGKTDGNLTPCGKCKSVSYCSFDCRRADSAKHKRSCT